MWSALDVFIGLALCYAMMSLICTVLQEFIAQAFNSRAKLLKAALTQANLDGLIETLKANTLTGGTASATFAKDKNGQKGHLSPDLSLPSFVHALLKTADSPNITIFNPDGAVDFTKANALLDEANLPPSLAARLKVFAGQTQVSVDQVTQAVKSWYDDFSDQLSHWYTRRAQTLSLLIALAVALALHVDTIDLASKFYNDTTTRQAAVALATQNASKANGGIHSCGPQNGEANFPACTAAVSKAFPFPLGWDFSVKWEATAAGLGRLLLTLLGITLSGLAISLGSRFWFDTLKTLVSIRTGGNTPTPSTNPSTNPAPNPASETTQ